MNTATLRPALLSDADAIAGIYNHYIHHTIITFEEAPVDGAEIANRIQSRLEKGLPWLVAEADGAILGYAYASPFKDRSAFRYTVEVSIYLAPTATGGGLGTRLYAELFRLLREEGKYHIAIGGISLPNEASVAIHEKFGMEKVAQFKEVGFKFGTWIDVGYWQVTL